MSLHHATCVTQSDTVALFSDAEKQLKKNQKNPETSEEKSMWDKAKMFEVPSAITIKTPFKCLRTDDKDLEVRPIDERHVANLTKAMTAKYVGKSSSVDTVRSTLLCLQSIAHICNACLVFVAEPDYILCKFASVNVDNSAALKAHLDTINTMNESGYQNSIKDGLQVLGGRHSHASVRAVAAKDPAFRSSEQFAYCNPKMVFFFPARTKEYIEMARYGSDDLCSWGVGVTLH